MGRLRSGGVLVRFRLLHSFLGFDGVVHQLLQEMLRLLVIDTFMTRLLDSLHEIVQVGQAVEVIILDAFDVSFEVAFSETGHDPRKKIVLRGSNGLEMDGLHRNTGAMVK